MPIDEAADVLAVVDASDREAVDAPAGPDTSAPDAQYDAVLSVDESADAAVVDASDREAGDAPAGPDAVVFCPEERVTPGCTCPRIEECEGDDRRNGAHCSGNRIVTCAPDVNGCQRERTMSCLPGQTCLGAPGAAACRCPPAPQPCDQYPRQTGQTCSGTEEVATCSRDPITGCSVLVGVHRCDSGTACVGEFPSAMCTDLPHGSGRLHQSTTED